ncbi:hypothetical protein MLD38_036955 [Melastoma candidum]|uniref:Uncharacterized protein n=1 Tax=Melastoma candidum TaxID=119954 RepID=A0ACB9LLJ2_9MYRT|nr:hypothetical protein MLD38_036955 [Melastoma candidum]
MNLRPCIESDKRKHLAFSDLKSLDALDLSGCSSLEVGGSSFRHMSSLKIRNELRSLPLDCFPVGLSRQSILSWFWRNPTSVVRAPQDFGSFQNLLDLRIDSCPQLEYIFSSPLVPQKLKSIDIKHCGKLATLFNSGSAPVLLPSLTSLVLWNLPMLQNIGAKLPREPSFTHWGYPNLGSNLSDAA